MAARHQVINDFRLVDRSLPKVRLCHNPSTTRYSSTFVRVAPLGTQAPSAAGGPGRGGGGRGEGGIRTGWPPGEASWGACGPLAIKGRPRASEGAVTAYAPRRTVLDKILVDAARDAGAEVREGFTVDEVVMQDGAVIGICGHGEGGKMVFERSRIVVGADGRHSHVAKAVQPEQYNAQPPLLLGSYTYWSALPARGFDN